MKNFLYIISYCLFGLFIALLTPAYSFDVKVGGEVYDYFYVENNFFNSSIALFNPDETYNILGFSPDLSFSKGNSFGGYLLADISWSNSMDATETDTFEMELTNAFLNLSKAKLSAQIGLQPFQFGKGFILSSDEPGIMLEFKTSQQFYVNAEAAQIMTSSIIASLMAGYKPDFLEKIELYGVWFRDTDKKMAELLNTISYIAASDNTIIDNSGDLFWFGANTDLFIGPFYLSGCIIYQYGNPSVMIENLFLVNSQVRKRYFDRSFSISSSLMDISIDYSISHNISIGVFVFFSPGDLTPDNSEINAFLSPIPFNPKTAIFFSGFGTIDGSDRIELGGTRWEGVLAPGIRLNYQIVNNMIIDTTLALLLPEKTPSDDRQVYGWEIDTVFAFNFRNKLNFIFEVDIFQYEDFFKSQGGVIPDPASRFLLGLNILF